MLIYRTASFDKELNSFQDLSYRVERLCSKLAVANFIRDRLQFKRLHSYLKRKEGNFRLIAKIIKIENESILCWLKVFNRGEPAYKNFLEASKIENNLFHESELKAQLLQWLEVIKLRKLDDNNSLPILPRNLSVWLNRPNYKASIDDTVIYEMRSWCDRFESSYSPIYYRELIEDIIIGCGNLGKSIYGSKIKLYGKDERYIIYSSFVTQDRWQQKVLILIAPLFGKPIEERVREIIESLDKWDLNFILGSNENNLTKENLISYSKRCYPDYLVLERDFWLKIERSKDINLAFSEEELAILSDIDNNQYLPLFLNGRAGSGKSTMLLHLFAYYCCQHFNYCQEIDCSIFDRPHPLFLTYSTKLSLFAKNKVQSLLQNHYKFIEDCQEFTEIKKINSFFQPFRSLLLNLLPNNERKRFLIEKHISFHLFREKFNSQWKDLTPEKCWSVIQTFIKGYYEPERGYLEDIKDYAKIPRKQRTVSIEEFKIISDRVWQWYQRYTAKNNLWDDRDLAIAVLNIRSDFPKYTVIFCDEAQDFSRLELQLIKNLSVFSQYNLEKETIYSLPFAFAGDPLQTLNPTGFRWDSFRSAFHDKIISPLNKRNRQNNIKIELKQLHYNYRSVAPIVEVNNSIQLWRKLFFNLSTIQPQIAKRKSNFVPQKFIIGENVTVENLKDILQDTIILLPCDEGEEADFIKRDYLLNSLRTEEEIPWNILSAISAKGLEFKQVILYKFGQHCPVTIGSYKQNYTEKVKYFLNKLYVAASRAMERLFIIDSFAGEIKLWNYASDISYLETLLSKIEDRIERTKWQNHIRSLSYGKFYHIMRDEDKIANATIFQRYGIENQNIDFLNRAIAIFQKFNKEQELDSCIAWKFKIEKKYNLAGELFLKIDRFSESWNCFWQGMNWDKLLVLIEEIKSRNKTEEDFVEEELLLPLINFMAVRKTKKDLLEDGVKQVTVEFANFLDREHRDNIFKEYSFSYPWQMALDRYQKEVKLLLQEPEKIDSSNWLTIGKTLDIWNGENGSENNLIIAECFYFGKDYDRAIQYWDKVTELANIDKNLRYYHRAKSNIIGFPQALKYLSEVKQYSLIIREWIERGRIKNDIWLSYLALALEKSDRIDKALILYCYLDCSQKVFACWKKINKKPLSIKATKILIKYYIDKQLWQQAIDLAENYLVNNEVKYYFIYKLVSSQLTYEKISDRDKQVYKKFVQENIINDSAWQRSLTLEHIKLISKKIWDI